MRVALVPLGPGHGSGEVSWNVLGNDNNKLCKSPCKAS
jgi:hypothetical protein